MSDLLGKPEDRFFRVAAQMITGAGQPALSYDNYNNGIARRERNSLPSLVNIEEPKNISQDKKKKIA